MVREALVVLQLCQSMIEVEEEVQLRIRIAMLQVSADCFFLRKLQLEGVLIHPEIERLKQHLLLQEK